MTKVYKFKKQTIYKSKPFIKKVRELDSSFISKYIFNILMLFILTSLTLSLSVPLLIHLNVNVFVIRGIITFSATWSLVFFIWWTIQTTQYFKLINNKTKWLAIFSFLPIINIAMIGVLFNQLKSHEFSKWLTWAFSKSKFENNPNNYFTKQWYLNLTTMIIMLPFFYFLFIYSKPKGLSDDYYNFWFGGIHFFTNQTNLLCFIFVLIYVIYPRMNLFNNDSVLICLMSYIFIASFTYNMFIIPYTVKDVLKDDYRLLIKGMWSHTVNPAFFIGCGIANMKTSAFQTKTTRDYLTLLKFGMVIPSVYLTYAFVLPFFSSLSVYGPITNCNPLTPNEIKLFGMEYGHPSMIIPIIGFWFVFVGVITMFWKIRYRFVEKAIKLEQINNRII